ncbi:MAG: hypothetical protein AB8B96_11060 [Lysobacterales bacterium]
MKNYRISAALLILIASHCGAWANEDLDRLGRDYFAARAATQAPNASAETLEQYLQLLAEDVGYEHKPYRALGEVAGGKARMREGMTYYLGRNHAYDARLLNVATGHKAVAIQYQVDWSGQRGGEGPLISRSYVAMEVLEVEQGKVTLIREYSP